MEDVDEKDHVEPRLTRRREKHPGDAPAELGAKVASRAAPTEGFTIVNCPRHIPARLVSSFPSTSHACEETSGTLDVNLREDVATEDCSFQCVFCNNVGNLLVDTAQACESFVSFLYDLKCNARQFSSTALCSCILCLLDGKG